MGPHLTLSGHDDSKNFFRYCFRDIRDLKRFAVDLKARFVPLLDVVAAMNTSHPSEWAKQQWERLGGTQTIYWTPSDHEENDDTQSYTSMDVDSSDLLSVLIRYDNRVKKEFQIARIDFDTALEVQELANEMRRICMDLIHR